MASAVFFMKKILVLLFLLVLKLSAYDYLIFYNQYAQGLSLKEIHLINENNKYWVRILGDNNVNYGTIYTIDWFNYIKRGLTNYYISNNDFQDLYKNDVIFLNDLYTSGELNRQCFLNYLYNNDIFTSSNYVHYDNYELLYNSDGLAVESIVNGVWAGLYNDNEKRRSGRLYSSTGELLYLNGVEVEHASLYDVINELLVVSVMEVFGIYSRAAVYAIYFIILMVLGGVILAVYLVTDSMDNTGSRGGARWVATFTANGVRKTRWNRFDPDNYHYQTGDRNFSSWRDYQDYERGLSNGTRSPIRKRRIF